MSRQRVELHQIASKLFYLASILQSTEERNFFVMWERSITCACTYVLYLYLRVFFLEMEDFQARADWPRCNTNRADNRRGGVTENADNEGDLRSGSGI